MKSDSKPRSTYSAARAFIDGHAIEQYGQV
jgi:hypothetical protein